MRIDLLDKMLSLHLATCGINGAPFVATLRRLFREQATALQAAEVAAGAPSGWVPLTYDIHFGPREDGVQHLRAALAAPLRGAVRGRPGVARRELAHCGSAVRAGARQQ
jgi:hypothetical protein